MLRILIYVMWQLVTSSHFFLEVLVTFFVWKENQSQNVGGFQCKRILSTLVPVRVIEKVLMKAHYFSLMIIDGTQIFFILAKSTFSHFLIFLKNSLKPISCLKYILGRKNLKNYNLV